MTNELLTARFNENEDQLELADMHLYDKIIKERNHNLVTTTLRFTKNEHDNMKPAKESRICSTLFCKRGNADANSVPFAEMSVEQKRKMASVTSAQVGQDGRLAEAVVSSKSGEMDVDQSRKLASETLVQASHEGSLAQALSSPKAPAFCSDDSGVCEEKNKLAA